jgi:drug/metabolite transporter (DMT)-like permease
VAAVVLALASAVLFGAFSVAIRWGQARVPDLDAGVGGVISVGSLAILAAAAVGLAVTGESVAVGELWPYFLIGLAVPGATQFLYQRSVRAAGAARPSIVIGTAPVLSVAIALVALDEPASWPIIVGTALIVGGTTLLALERLRPEHVRRIGLVLAGACAALFAVRDNVVRVAADHVDAPSLQAAAAPIAAGAVAGWAVLVLVSRRDLLARVGASVRPMLPAGLIFASALGMLVIAFTVGRVSIVAPLNATQALFAVGFAHLVYPASERIGPRTVLAAALVVAGGVIVGVLR